VAWIHHSSSPCLEVDFVSEMFTKPGSTSPEEPGSTSPEEPGSTTCARAAASFGVDLVKRTFSSGEQCLLSAVSPRF